MRITAVWIAGLEGVLEGAGFAGLVAAEDGPGASVTVASVRDCSRAHAMCNEINNCLLLKRRGDEPLEWRVQCARALRDHIECGGELVAGALLKMSRPPSHVHRRRSGRLSRPYPPRPALSARDHHTRTVVAMSIPLVSNAYLDESSAKVRAKPVPWEVRRDEGYMRGRTHP